MTKRRVSSKDSDEEKVTPGTIVTEEEAPEPAKQRQKKPAEMAMENFAAAIGKKSEFYIAMQ